MKHNHKLLQIISALLACLCLSGTALAADAEETDPAAQAAAAPAQANTRTEDSYAYSDTAVEVIKRYEGFTESRYWYAGVAYIGYGSNYADAVKVLGEDCEPITEAQAEQVTRYQLAENDKYLSAFLKNNGIVVNQNQYDALVDFTYNGIGWMYYKNDDGSWCLLKQMLLDDPSTWTRERTVEAFGAWVKDGNGNVLPGLVKRRAEDAELFLSDEEKPNETGYTDVKTSQWYYEYVLEAKEKGLMNGMGDGTFRPDDTLTRAQLVKALANYDGAELPETAKSDFTDVADGEWYTPAIVWAAENGYVNGMGGGTFHPDETVTREQICTILSRYFAKKQADYPITERTFTDEDTISAYALEHVRYCAGIGLIAGMGDGTFAPQAGTTRAQAATILVRMSQLG